MPTDTRTSAVAAIDPVKGKAALERLKPKLLAIPDDEVRPPNTDLTGATTKVYAVCNMLKSEPELAARFQSLPAAEFDHEALGELETAADVVEFTRSLLTTMVPAHSSAKVPLALIQKGGVIKDRMQRLLEYHFSPQNDDPVYRLVAEALASIRSGTGHFDTARDLKDLAMLHREHRALIENDPVYFRASDADEAESTARSIQDAVGEDRKLDPERDLARRAWTFMVNTYDEVASTGRWLLRHTGEGERRFPPLAHGGNHRARRKAVVP